MTSTPESDHLEKEGTASPRHHEHHHHLFHHGNGHGHGRHFLEFVHPHSGKTLHVCQSPEQLEEKRSELLRVKSAEEFDLILHGSPEHLSAIRDLHAQQEAKRAELKQRHGDVFKDFEHVKDELDALAAEIHQLTNHAVSLDASFDRYGYSAHLRTKDEDSETTSLHSEHPSASEKHKDRSVEALKFVKRPTVRQYFHKGLLWRSAKAGEVASFELFLDLVYVGIIDVIGEKAVEHAGGLSLLQFIIIFTIAWKIWSDMTMVINHFEIDDIFQRFCVIFFLVCLFGFTTNIFYAFESTYTSAIAFYVTQRLFGAAWYMGIAVLLPNIRGTMVATSILIVISAAIWIVSIHVEWPNQLAPIFLAIFLDLFGGVFLIYIMKEASRNTFSRRIGKWFEFFPAINIEHRVERNNAFVSLVSQQLGRHSHVDISLTIETRCSATPSLRSCFNPERLLGLMRSLERVFSAWFRRFSSTGRCSLDCHSHSLERVLIRCGSGFTLKSMRIIFTCTPFGDTGLVARYGSWHISLL